MTTQLTERLPAGSERKLLSELIPAASLCFAKRSKAAGMSSAIKLMFAYLPTGRRALHKFWPHSLILHRDAQDLFKRGLCF
jgi:hypothetical protein